MKKDFTIYYTSDTHGKVLPVDYASGAFKRRGLMEIAQGISKDGNTIVVDGGDSLQGSPFISYYLEHQGDFDTHPIAYGFNAMGLDVYTLGNHDFNFGYEALLDYTSSVNATLVCANVEDKPGQLGIKKTYIKTLENGLKVGFTGLVTDYVNLWEKPEHMVDFVVTDPLKAAKEALAELQGKCDVTICIYHGGYERDLLTGESLTSSRENIACQLAEETDFDLLLTGHQHMAVEKVVLNGTYSLQPPCDADKYFRIDVSYDDNDKSLAFDSHLVDIEKDCEKDSYAALQPLEDATEKWLDQEIGRLQEAIEPEEKLDVALRGSKLAALFNEIMLSATGADFACSSLGNKLTGFPESVSIRSVYTAYEFANILTVKTVTKAVIKECLERCACYLELDNSGKPYIGDTFLKPKIEHYNYDFYAGLDYAFDLTKPRGQRVVRLNKLDGSPLLDDATYTLVTSDYRATGTGGYEALGKCPVAFAGADNMQDLIIDYIRNHDIIEIPDNYRFEVIY